MLDFVRAEQQENNSQSFLSPQTFFAMELRVGLFCLHVQRLE